MGRLQPAVRHLRYLLSHTTQGMGDDSHFIDLARDLSAVNRRAYRQGKIYHVAGATVHDSSGLVWTRIGVAPDTWITRNAWYKAYRLWKAMNEQVTEEPTSSKILPKYHDFKVFLNTNHRTHHPSTDVSGPVDLQGNEVGRGEWEYSKYFLPAEGGSATPDDHDETDIHLLGATDGSLGSFNSVGIIAGYEESRAKVQASEPSVPASVEHSWMTNLFDTGDTFDDIIEELEVANDAPPYVQNDYTGGGNQNSTNPFIQPVQVGQTFTNSSINVGRIGPFSAICGLIEVITRSTNNNTIGLTLELMPGKYKGVAASAVRQ